MEIPHLMQAPVDAWKKFLKDDVPQAAAALSFYAVTALPPFVVILVSVLGMVYVDNSAGDQLSRQVATLFGASAAEMISTIVDNRSASSHGAAALVGTVVLLVGASGFFGQLQKALNHVWGVRLKASVGIGQTIKKRLLSMSAVLGTGFFFFFSLLLSAFVSAAGGMVEEFFGIGATVTLIGETLVALLLVTGLFGLIFKFLPDVLIGWQDVWRGALTTALLFMVGKTALGWYLGRADFAADYGSAGAVILILFWVYYSSMILLYGAALTQVQTESAGRPVTPESHAEFVKPLDRSDTLERDKVTIS